MICGPLNVGLAAQRVDSAAGHAHVAQQELQNGIPPDVLRAVGVLGGAHGVHDRSGHSGLARLRERLAHLEIYVLGGTRNLGDLIRSVARNVLLQKLEDAVRVLERLVLLGDPLAIELVLPGALVVLARFRIVAAEYPVQILRQLELGMDQERGVGVLPHVLHVVVAGVLLHIVQDVLDHAVDKGDVRPGTQRRIDMRLGGRPRETRVHADQLCPALNSPGHPLKGDGVILRGIAADDHDPVGVAQINPVIGHRAAPKCLGQTGHSGGVSYSRLVFYVLHPQGPHELGVQVAFLVVHCHAAESSNVVGAVDLASVSQTRIPRFLDPLGNPVNGPIPGLLLPMAAPRRAIQDLGQPALVIGDLVEGTALAAEGPFVDRMIRIPLNVDHLPIAG